MTPHGGAQPWRHDVSVLLDRPEVVLDHVATEAWLEGCKVLITGAAGSIGSGIARRLARWRLGSLLLLDRSENELYRLEEDLRPESVCPVRFHLADLTEPGVARQAVEEYAPHVVFHAAAYKHVPLLERHPAAAVRNNIGATRALAEAAQDVGVERFVFVSTDKAIRPSSIMGASKRVAEMLLQGLACETRTWTRFITVRFGNVLDSAGNVVERFSEQISRGGPVTITHPGMTRYFMTRAEASSLMLEAGMLGRGGDVFMLEIDRPRHVMDLALRMIALAQLEAGSDIQIVTLGPRLGEKLAEDYASSLELWPTESPHVLRALLPAVDSTWIRTAIDELLDLARNGPGTRLTETLARIVPEYRSDRTWVDMATTAPVVPDLPRGSSGS